MRHQRQLLVYTPVALPISQQFVADQLRHLERWTPTLVARRRVPGVDIDRYLVTGVPDGHGFVARAKEVAERATRRVGPLRRTSAHLRPDLVHAHFLTGGFDVVRNVDPSVPVAVTAHGFDVTWHGTPPATWNPARWLHGRLRQDLVRRPGVHFIAVSKFVAERLVALGAPPGRVVVHHIGTDLEVFSPPPARASRSGVLFVGRLVEKKGVSDLVEALEHLRSHGVSTPTDVIGDGPQRRWLERRIEASGLPVRLHGAQSREVIALAMRRAAILCGPSRPAASGDEEGFGMVFVEAQASGLPVVATTSGGIPDAVASGVTGLLVPPGAPRALAAALGELLESPDRLAQMGQAARDRAATDFDLVRQTRRLEDLYSEWSAG